MIGQGIHGIFGRTPPGCRASSNGRHGVRAACPLQALSVTASNVRDTKPSFILTSATVRVSTSADCPENRQGTQEIRPIFFVANVGNHHLYSKGCITWFAFWLLFGSTGYTFHGSVWVAQYPFFLFFAKFSPSTKTLYSGKLVSE